MLVGTILVITVRLLELTGTLLTPAELVTLALGMGSNAAAALYASSVLFEPAFSLMTIDIPFWQCPTCPQYIQMGVVSFTRTEKTGMLPPGETGMKPDLMPVTLDKMLWIGTQGLSNVDCVTVWFWTDLHVSCGKGVLEGEGVCVPLAGTGTAPRNQEGPLPSQGSTGECCQSGPRLVRLEPGLCLIVSPRARRTVSSLRLRSLLCWMMPQAHPTTSHRSIGPLTRRPGRWRRGWCL